MGQVLQLDSQFSKELLAAGNSRLYYILEEFIRNMNKKFEDIESTVINTLISADGSGNLAEGTATSGSTYAIDPSGPSELTIASGEVTVTGSIRMRYHTIDTEGDAGSDFLDTVNGGNMGDILILEAEDSARTVVCRPGGSLRIRANFALDHVANKLFLWCQSTGVWDQWGRATNA